MKRVIALPALIGVFVLACEQAPSSTDAPAPTETPSLKASANRDRQPLVVEFAGASDFTDATMAGDELGWSQLKRHRDKLQAIVHAQGLIPGGVFTFWWVVPQDDYTFPDDIFVAYGASAIIGQYGKATVRMTAEKGDPSIVGLPALEGALFGDLVDPANSLVRVEVAYHGQVEDAGDDLDQWRSDFWTGSACPVEGDTNAFGQPHCPVYLAATHAPPGM
jgi:hypothetical protein